MHGKKQTTSAKVLQSPLSDQLSVGNKKLILAWIEEVVSTT